MKKIINISSQVVSVLYVPDIDGHTTLVFTYVIYAFVCQAIALSGIVTNILNIICFVKQGFKDSVNITLLGLTISDSCCLITIILTNISVIPALHTADLPFDVLGVYYLAVGMPHVTFSRLSAWITAIITLERCLCITAPLKVFTMLHILGNKLSDEILFQIKMLLTSKRMFVVIVCVYITLIASGAPVYAVNKLGMTFSPWRNKTILGLVSDANKESVEKVSFAINSFFLPFAAFAVIIICTAILVISLQKRAKWRQASAVMQHGDVSSRHMKVAKMVVMISTLFISCFLPMSVSFLVVALVPGFNIYGKYINIGMIVGGLATLTECINSSGNVFIYYHMSFKYRETFNSIFCRSKPDE